MATRSEVVSDNQIFPKDTCNVSGRLELLLGEEPSIRQLRMNDSAIEAMIAKMLQIGLPKPPIVPQEEVMIK